MLAKSLLIASFLLAFHYTNCEKLDVILLYEALCPDSLQFIDDQLYPVGKELGDYLTITYVPFGNANSTDNGKKFVCEHGPRECLGNRILSCGEYYLRESQKDQLEYIKCFMDLFNRDNSSDQLGQSCITHLGVSWNSMASCLETLSYMFELINEGVTKRFHPTFIPTIVLNGVFNQTVQDESLTDFRKVICDHLGHRNPNPCAH